MASPSQVGQYFGAKKEDNLGVMLCMTVMGSECILLALIIPQFGVNNY